MRTKENTIESTLHLTRDISYLPPITRGDTPADESVIAVPSGAAMEITDPRTHAGKLASLTLRTLGIGWRVSQDADSGHYAAHLAGSAETIDTNLRFLRCRVGRIAAEAANASSDHGLHIANADEILNTITEVTLPHELNSGKPAFIQLVGSTLAEFGRTGSDDAYKVVYE